MGSNDLNVSVLFPSPSTRESGLFWKFCFSWCLLMFLGYRSHAHAMKHAAKNKSKQTKHLMVNHYWASFSLMVLTHYLLPSYFQSLLSVALYIFPGFSFFATVRRTQWCVLTPLVWNQKSDSHLIVAIWMWISLAFFQWKRYFSVIICMQNVL